MNRYVKWSGCCLIGLFCSIRPTLAIPEESTLRAPVELRVRVALNGLMFNGGAPDEVGFLISPTTYPSLSEVVPQLVLTNTGPSSDYLGTISLPVGTRRDLEFAIVVSVDGRWRREPLHRGIGHVALLNPAEPNQEIALNYDSEVRRIVPTAGSGSVVDNYLLAAGAARNAGDAPAAQRYEYSNAIRLLQEHRYPEAVVAYDTYSAAANNTLLSKATFDRFYMLYAKSLDAAGRSNDGIQILSDRQQNEGDSAYQADNKFALAVLLEKVGRQSEARNIFRTLGREAQSVLVRHRASLRLGVSFTEESDPDSVRSGVDILSSLGDAPCPLQRTALLALAGAQKRLSKTYDGKGELSRAMDLGTRLEGLAVKVQLLDRALSSGEFSSVHQACGEILAGDSPGRHRSHLLYLDACALKGLGQVALAKTVVERLVREHPGSGYAEYLIGLLGDTNQTTETVESVGTVENLP